MIIKDWRHAPQASIHSPTLMLSPIFVLYGEKGYRWMKWRFKRVDFFIFKWSWDGKRTMLRVLSLIPRLLFHFLTSFLQRRKLCSRPLFHFLMSFPQRSKTILKTSPWSWLPRGQCSGRNTCQGINVIHGFQEIFARWKKNSLEGIHVDNLDKGKEIWF